MGSERTKILPLLIVVAMLAFSVRLADFSMGVSSSISGAAMAEEDAREAARAKAEQIRAAEKAAMEEKAAMAKSETMMAKPDEEELMETDDPPLQWRDPTDNEGEFNAVKMELTKSLVDRRKKLDQREQNVMTREALLKAAEQELDRKIQELSALRGEIMGLLKQQSEEEEARIASLVKIYEGMKPKDAARIFDTLDLDVLVAVMGRMSERKLSPVLAARNPERARTITIMLAEQKKLPDISQQ